MLETMPPDWNPHLKLEFAKVCIRSIVEKVQAERKTSEKTEEDMVNEELEEAIEKLTTGETHTLNRGLVDYVEEPRNKKAAIIEEKGRRLAQKLGTKWYNEGEKSTRYFLRLLNRSTPDDFKSIEDVHGNKLTEEKLIEDEIVRFYKDLYEDNANELDINEGDLNNFFANVHPLSGAEENILMAPVTTDELRKVLHECSDSAPGPDGIPYSIIGALWPTFGSLLSNAWNFSLVTGNLPPSHKTSFLKLIPKAGKDLNKLTNWRPITLSNCDHKLITKLYAKRLSQQVESHLGARQTAYLKGRLINDNIRSMLATVNISNLEDNCKGLIVALNAKKAFDSVSHKFIEACLKKFGCPNFVPIFRILYKDLRTDIIINGRIVPGFNIKRGVKQGDSLSCIIFIMCMEPLLLNIEKNDRIKALSSTSLNSYLPKVYAYADDVNATIKDEQDSLQNLFDEYNKLTLLSGLELNANKTEILRLGSNDERVYRVNYRNKYHVINSSLEVKINGVLFQRDPNRLRKANVENVVSKMEKHLKSWTRRSLSTLGRILILKTFGISQAIFLMQSMKLECSDFKTLNALLYKFLWNRNFHASKAPERIKREIVNTPIKFGGLGMLDISELDKSLKLKALGRMLKSEHPFLKLVQNKLDLSDFFNPKLSTEIEKVASVGIELIKGIRAGIWLEERLNTNKEIIAVIRHIDLSKLISANGLRSIPYFLIRRNGPMKIKDLDRRAFDSIARYIDPVKVAKVKLALSSNLGPPQDYLIESIQINGKIKAISTCSSKEIREAHYHKPQINSFKLGLYMTDLESKTWSLRLSKLTSTRHKDTLLKAAHGDVYTKAKLHRFGLIDSSTCPRCDEIEDLSHKILSCGYASRIWDNFLQLGNRLTGSVLPNTDRLNLIMGNFRMANLSYLTLAAEIIQRLLYLKDTETFLIRPKIFVENCAKAILSKETNLEIKETLYSALSRD